MNSHQSKNKKSQSLSIILKRNPNLKNQKKDLKNSLNNPHLLKNHNQRQMKMFRWRNPRPKRIQSKKSRKKNLSLIRKIKMRITKKKELKMKERSKMKMMSNLIIVHKICLNRSQIVCHVYVSKLYSKPHF